MTSGLVQKILAGSEGLQCADVEIGPLAVPGLDSAHLRVGITSDVKPPLPLCSCLLQGG